MNRTKTQDLLLTLCLIFITLNNSSAFGDEQPIISNQEIEATRRDARYWLENMLHYHNYSLDEAAYVFDWDVERLQKEMRQFGVTQQKPAIQRTPIVVLPYPGGRHPRIGFLDGAVNPMRGSKASAFLPGDPDSYVVIDLPEAIWCNGELLFLAHTHIPTMWDRQMIKIPNSDWTRHSDGSLENTWTLPNGVRFGATIRTSDRVNMELWLTNGSHKTLTGLLVQVCVLLKEAHGFNALTNDNKTYAGATANVTSNDSRAISTAWEKCDRAWGNEDVPCLHSDPKFPDCPPGETVRVKGELWFHDSK
ncbi:hypothetical protein K8I31_03020 [bacterium]|nr:hypothetical protein [bacterium]